MWVGAAAAAEPSAWTNPEEQVLQHRITKLVRELLGDVIVKAPCSACPPPARWGDNRTANLSG